MVAHHPPEAQLLDYATGASSEPAGLILATHLALCPACRRQLRGFEAIGGALLEAQPVATSSNSDTAGTLARMLARLDEPEPAETASAARDETTRHLLPEPLRSYLGVDLDAIVWRRVARGLDEHVLPLDRPGFKTRLLRIHRGAAIPRHGHRGTESVLVLDGGFTDETGHYARGDIGVSDASIVHRPVADEAGDCLCLAVVEGRLRFAGLLGRLLDLFARY